MEEMSLEQGLEEIGHKILVLTRNELYVYEDEIYGCGAFGVLLCTGFFSRPSCYRRRTMYFNGQMLGGEYRQNRIGVNRAYSTSGSALPHFSDMYFAEMDGKSLYGTWRGYCGRICD